MSDSIWKTADQKPDKNCPIVFRNNIGVIYCALDPKSTFLMRLDHKWAYLHEVVNQADKAERLQKAVDNSREKLAAFMHDVWGNWFVYQLNNSTIENLQRWGIQSNTPYSSLTETDKDKDRKFADKIIEIIKDEIKQLIKENQ